MWSIVAIYYPNSGRVQVTCLASREAEMWFNQAVAEKLPATLVPIGLSSTAHSVPARMLPRGFSLIEETAGSVDVVTKK